MPNAIPFHAAVCRSIAFFAVLIGLLVSATVWASADCCDTAEWTLQKIDYDPDGTSAMLAPSNDTRANLMLLMLDAARLSPPAEAGDQPLTHWYPMMRLAEPAVDPKNWEASRCQSDEKGRLGFTAAVQSSRRLSATEKLLLADARAGFRPGCDTGGNGLPPLESLASTAGRQFSQYLRGAALFYAGEFDAAKQEFSQLVEADDPWLRETSLYMVARTDLNHALASSIDEYGSLAAPEARDHSHAKAAGNGFEAYLKAFPDGRYSRSAAGLMRRVYWLSGDKPALAAAFAPLVRGKPSADLLEEIDNKLLTPEGPLAIGNPTLLAVVDLRRMRCKEASCGGPLTREELQQQGQIFSRDPELFQYLLAAHAFFVEQRPREVLRLISAGAWSGQFSYLQLSSQMLRGLALDAIADPAARSFWVGLLPRANAAYQRGAVELALAMHDERTGTLDLAIESPTKVRAPVIRQMLLENAAGPALLRRHAADRAVSAEERRIAAYILLAKELRRGFYREFLADAHLVSETAKAVRSSYTAARYRHLPPIEPATPPIGLFAADADVGSAGCPPLYATVRQLASNRKAVRPQLCLAEYFSVNGFDGFEFDLAGDEHRGELGFVAPQFPGEPYDRLAVYRGIIGKPAASADDKAFALNRAIRCFAPTGRNRCSKQGVDEAQRKAWFRELKHFHAKSRWSTSLEYYW